MFPATCGLGINFQYGTICQNALCCLISNTLIRLKEHERLSFSSMKDFVVFESLKQKNEGTEVNCLHIKFKLSFKNDTVVHLFFNLN